MRTLALLVAAAASAVWAGSASAQPVEYVRVCDTFGTGFFYIPGTDTCLKLGGYVRGEVELAFQSDDDEDWEVRATFAPYLDLRTNTAYGTLRAFLEGDFQVGHRDSVTEFTPDKGDAYLAFESPYASLLGGWTDSLYDFVGEYTYVDEVRSDATVLQARASWMMGGWAIGAGLENPHDRGIDSDVPAVVVSLAPSAMWGFTASAAFTDTPYGFGAAFQLGTEVPIHTAVTLRAVGAVAHNAQSYVGLEGASPGWGFGGTLAAKLTLRPGLQAVAAIGFADSEAGDERWLAVAGIHWHAVPDKWELGAELFHGRTDDDTRTGVLLRVQYDF
jgi:hypothetical protein